MANTVSVRLAVDSKDAISAFNGLGGSMTGAIAKGNLLATGITSALGAVVNVAKGAAGAFAGAFKDVANTSLANIGSAGDLAKLTGMSFAEAQGNLRGFTKDMSVLANSLPGDTADFVALGIGISDNLAPAFRDLNGVFDKNKFGEYRADLAKFATVRADFSGITTADASLGLSKLLGGASTAELASLKFFEANPAVLATIESELAKTGKDIKSLSVREIADLARTALSVQDEVLAAASNDAKGIMAAFKGSLFDPNVGIFGFAKDLDDTVAGDQSVFASLSRIIKKIFGSEGIIGKAANIFGNLTGLDADSPMDALASGIGKFGAWLDKVNRFLGDRDGDFKNGEIGGDKSLGSMMGGFAKGLGKGVAGLANKLFSGLANIDTKQASASIGGAIALAINAATKYIGDLSMIDIGKALVNIGIVLAGSLVQVFKAIDWLSMAEAIGTGALVAGLAAAAFFAATFTSIGATITAAVISTGPLVIGAIVAGAGLAIAIVQSVWDEIGGAFRNLLSVVKSSVANLIPDIGPIRQQSTQGRRVRNNASGLDQDGLFSAINRERQAMPTGASIVVANDSEMIMNRQQQRGLSGALGSRGSNVLNFNGNIIVQGNDDPGQVARQVMSHIEREWTRFNSNQIAPEYS